MTHEEDIEKQIKELAIKTYGETDLDIKLMAEHLVALLVRVNQLQEEISILKSR